MKDQIDLITQQQETGHKEWTESESSLEFWQFYAAWCLENGLFNDRASHQTSMIREL